MNPKKKRTPCPVCDAEPYRSFYKYCSNACQREFEYQKYIAEWKSGERTGLSSMGIVTSAIKKYLRIKFNNRCVLCGWAEVSRSTNEVPLVADHIDGNWRNNLEENLRLLCPNCDALTPTFSALNKGRGRPNRVVSKRALEAKRMAQLARKKRM
jgi:hypothetical protein